MVGASGWFQGSRGGALGDGGEGTRLQRNADPSTHVCMYRFDRFACLSACLLDHS